MKTITLNNDNRSIIITEDTDTVVLETNHVKRNEERIYGLHKTDVTLHENVTIPQDWAASKYMFDGVEWTLNPDYQEEPV